MGNLSRIPLAELVAGHELNTLIETGTGHGDSVIAALTIPALIDIRSIEIDPETYARACRVFRHSRRVTLYLWSSPYVLPNIVGTLPGDRRALWFLDAHFPGSGRVRPVPMDIDNAALVPIADEFDALQGRDLSSDVIVVDDLCMFEPGDYQADAPEFRERLKLPSLRWLEKSLEATHVIHRYMHDGGYFVARPRGTANGERPMVPPGGLRAP